MAEHSFDLMGEFGTPANGHGAEGIPAGATVPETPVTEAVFDMSGDVVMSETPDGARLDAARGVFITSRGNEIQLSDRVVSSLIVERLAQEGKPKIPMVEVTLLGKHRQLEPNSNHEGYKAQLAEWESENQIRILKYIFTVGIKGSPPPEFRDEYSAFFPGISDIDLKYLWVATLVPDEDIDSLSEAIMGRTLPTVKGVEEASNFTG